MASQNKKILNINLSKQSFDVKINKDSDKYMGGLGLAAKAFSDCIYENPIVFAVGPLNGYFPYASKTCILYKNNKGALKDQYIGGSLSSRIKYAGLDAIVFTGKASEPLIIDITDEKVTFRSLDTDQGELGLPGKRTFLQAGNKFFVDDYFSIPGNDLNLEIKKKNISSVIVTGTKTFDMPDNDKYLEIYKSLLSKTDKLSIEKSGNASCVGCPMGCEKSFVGESIDEALINSLVVCSYAHPLFENVNEIFSCLDSLGFGFTHEDLENFPQLVYDLLEEIKINE